MNDQPYQFPPQQRQILESLRFPLAAYQFVGGRVVTLLVSDGMCDFHQTTREALTIGFDSSMFETVHPDDVEAMAKIGYRFATKEGPYDVVYRSRIPHTQDYRTIHSISKFQSMADGTRVAFTIYMDISQSLEQAQLNALELGAPITRFLDEGVEPLIVVDRKTKSLLYFNKAALRLLKPPVTYDSGMTFNAFFYPDIPQGMAGLFDEVDVGLRTIRDPRSGGRLGANVISTVWNKDPAYVVYLYEMPDEPSKINPETDLRYRRMAFNGVIYSGYSNQTAYDHPEFSGFWVWNLSENKLILDESHPAIHRDLGDTISFDAFRNYLLDRVDPEDRPFIRQNDCQHLILKYENGTFPRNCTLTLNTGRGRVTLRCELTPLRSPDDGQVYLKIQEENITGASVMETIIQQIVERDYDYLVYIDPQADTCRVFMARTTNASQRSFTTDFSSYHSTLADMMGLPHSSSGDLLDWLGRFCEDRTVPHTFQREDGRIKSITCEEIGSVNPVYYICCQDVTTVLGRDVVTGEYTRMGFINAASQIIQKGAPDQRYALIYFNVRSFKAINELFGIKAGDQALRQITAALKDSLLRPLAIGRMESDHFTCLVAVENLDYDVLTGLCHQTYKRGGKLLHYTLSCGIYLTGKQAIGVSGMYDRAKMANERIQNEFARPYAVFNKVMRQEFLTREALNSELQHALTNREFKVYYQPIYDTRTRRIASAEALVRWIHPEHGIVSPGQFIPAFEKNGTISELDLYVTGHVHAFLEGRFETRRHLVPVAVNLSRVDFYDEAIMAAIQKHLKTSPLPRGLVNYEVTESAFVSLSENGLALLKEMKEAGARLLMDDFGSGYSSFSTMQAFSFDVIKLDMSFIQEVGQSQRADQIVQSMIELSHILGAKVVAEGAETAAQVDFLTAHGCDFIQGFYFSRPLPEAEFAALLDQ